MVLKPYEGRGICAMPDCLGIIVGIGINSALLIPLFTRVLPSLPIPARVPLALFLSPFASIAELYVLGWFLSAKDRRCKRLIHAGNHLVDRGEMTMAMSPFQRLFAIAHNNTWKAMAAYNLCISHARAGNKDESLRWLEAFAQLALYCGSTFCHMVPGRGEDWARHVEEDPDLSMLRERPEFKLIVRTLTKA